MKDKFKPNLSQLNQWLKDGNVGVRVELRGSRLSLVATVDKKQRRFSTGLRLNKEGLAEAKKLALDLGAGKIPGKEDVPITPPPLKVKEAIAKFKADWDAKYTGIKRQVTWEKDYAAVFSRLPQDAQLSAELLLERP